MQKKNLCKENGKEIRFGTGQMLHAGESWEGSLGGKFRPPPGDATTNQCEI